MSAGPLRPEARVLAWALVLLVALVALNPGGATGDLHRALVVLALSLLAGAHAWARWHDADDVPLAARLPSVAALIVLAAACAQLVSLPHGLVAALAPATGALHAAEAAALGVEPPARPLSIEPIATWRTTGLILAYLSTFLVARAIGRDPRAPSRAALGLALVGGAVALASVAVQSGEPVWHGRAAWPFVNPNHLATFLVVALGLALGVALAPLPEGESARSDTIVAHASSRRGLAWIAVALIVVGVLRTQSRAGAIAAGAVAVAAVALGGRLRPGAVAGVAAVAVLVAGAVLGTSDDAVRLVERFGQVRGDSLGGRSENWAIALRVAQQRPWGGAGLATFDDASLAVLEPTRGPTRPGEAHNDYLELIAGIGWPAAVLAILLLLGAVGATVARVRALGDARARSVAAGATAAVLGALLHAWFDFGLQLPAIALITCVSLGLAVGGASSGAPRGPSLARRVARVALALVLALLGASSSLQTWREARAHEAAARAWERTLRPELQAELARRARPALEEAEGRLASAAVAWERALIEQLSQDPGSSEAAVEHARRAAARAPARAAVQAQLGLALLQSTDVAAVTSGADVARLEAEGVARLDLAGVLGPTVPSILLARGEWALVRLGRTGDPARAREAKELLAAALRRDPSYRPRVRDMLARRVAVLGAQGEALREELGL